MSAHCGGQGRGRLGRLTQSCSSGSRPRPRPSMPAYLQPAERRGVTLVSDSNRKDSALSVMTCTLPQQATDGFRTEGA